MDKDLKERGGSSLQAIKKYIAANYKVDEEKVAPFFKKYPKALVASGSLVQMKSKGASGSFKLASATSSGSAKPSSNEKKNASGKTKKTTTAKRSITTTEENPKAVKKSAKSKYVPTAGKERLKSEKDDKSTAASKIATSIALPAKVKAPTKAKESNKGFPTKKPKAPKPKTAKARKVASSKNFIMAGSYEHKQKRLLSMWQDIQEEEVAIGSENDEESHEQLSNHSSEREEAADDGQIGTENEDVQDEQKSYEEDIQIVNQNEDAQNLHSEAENGRRWILNPFDKSIELADVTTKMIECLLDSAADGMSKMEFYSQSVNVFWMKRKHEALKLLVPFATSYLCELTFSSMV
ncbi:unnamed protein product [Psylliodes chrysocephalus]|uniref:H15 domain-containing protein n=1 Tax=Psylliodes chrysocephalus TaxID=3402493 RepID=A0A9P0GL40_9CUCU|nr:unnamed protein product [Psylliodes chrysocephala]